mmetsp:Transcript_38416/g.82567  ORF Transcript_38416/g.82567 Transcript_38416/m.82567 type:complete len:246 (-) Transcript_38416:238-975(-)
MRGQELWHGAGVARREPGHGLGAAARVEARLGHELQAQRVRLVLARPGVGQLQAQHQRPGRNVHSQGEKEGRAEHGDGHLLRDFLRVVPRHRMADLVRQDHGELVLALEHFEEPRVHDDLPPRQHEGVHLVRVDDVELPLDVLHVVDLAPPGRERLRLLGDLLAHLPHEPRQLVVLRKQPARAPVLLQELPVHLAAEPPLLLRRHQNEVRPPRVGHDLQVVDVERARSREHEPGHVHIGLVPRRR